MQATLLGHEDNINSLVQLQDGRLLSGSSDHTLRVWDLTSNSCVAVLNGHHDHVPAQVYDVIQLKDGRVVSCKRNEDTSILVWDLASEAVLQALQGHTDQVFALAQLEDGRIVSGSQDETIRVWSPTV